MAAQDHPALPLTAGIWALLSLVMLAGAGTYYASSFPPEAAYALVALSVPFALWASRAGGSGRTLRDLWREHAHHMSRAALGAAAIALFFLALLARAFAHAATQEPIRSLWLTVSPSALVAAFVAFLLLSALLLRGRERVLSLPLTGAALFVFLSAAVLVFPLGFGFDPFIHRATVEHIAQFGSIEPKPLYYVGQYALELFLIHGFSLPAHLVDVWLLPALTALLLPGALYAAASHLTRDRRLAAATLMAAFLLPLSSFVVTTPQGLANLWTLLLVLFAVPMLVGHGRPDPIPLALGALATAAVHPIAGIPALVFLALAKAARGGAHPRIARAAFWGIALAGSAAIPAAFALNAARGAGGGIDLSGLTPSALFSSLHLGLFVQNGFRPLLDFAELWARNGFAALILLSAFGAWKARRDGMLAPFLAMTLVLGVNYLLLSTAVDFSFLIDYERGNYASRLLPLIAFFLAPALLVGFAALLARVRAAPPSVRAGTTLLAAALATAALYATYPRHDAFVVGHGINVSRFDVEATYEIERVSLGRPYLVLANQSVSAAAIRNLGFARYYGEQFFYSIPTGGDLYQVFLAMNEAPTKETAFRAFDIVDALCAVGCMRELPASVYFVVNDYWWQADRIVEQAKASADAWFAVGDGAVTVFRYDLPTN